MYPMSFHHPWHPQILLNFETVQEAKELVKICSTQITSTQIYSDCFSFSGMASAIAAGISHFCSLMTDGSVWCWGGNYAGQLGTGNFADNFSPTAVPVEGDQFRLILKIPCNVYQAGARVVSIAAGYDHNCVLQANGNIKCWGSNSNGQLGNGNTINAVSPTDVSLGGMIRPNIF
jgi:alpha-tubulin suppressor-like RCC1 family protein